MAEASQTQSATLELELVSPEKLLLSQQVTMAVIPGAEGQLGVLAGHVPLITALDKGVISVYQQDKITDRIFISGGFAEIDGRRCMVLVEDAVSVDALDADKLKQSLSDLTEDWEDAKNDVERTLIQHEIDLTKAKLTAVGVAA